MSQKGLSPALIGIIVIALVAIATTAVIVINNQPTQGGSPEQVNRTESSAEFASYQDGIYQARGSYVSPGGLQTIDLTVTIENGVIVATSLSDVNAKAESLEYIQRFAGGYEAEVVGKPVNEVSLSRVAGSSLTSIGFNDALDQIKRDAQS